MQQIQLSSKLKETALESNFSGTVLVQRQSKIWAAGAYGMANQSEERPNDHHTRFGIASGCKLFTAIAVGQLVQQGKLTFNTKILDILEADAFPHFNQEITVHHLLTHSSGIADYFDEETMDDFEVLWTIRPMYSLRRLSDFIPMFCDQPMKFAPGSRFHYNNAGYIMLGLLVEKLSGMPFTDYVEQHIFAPCGMQDSGYFSFDSLPAHTALGYIEGDGGTWRTNIYSLPVKGGSDGGAYVTAPDMLLLWDHLLQHKLLSPEITALLLTPHMLEGKENYYGYGVWITKRDGEMFKYHVMGYDPGVSFHSAVYPAYGAAAAVLCNKSRGAYRMMQVVEDSLSAL